MIQSKWIRWTWHVRFFISFDRTLGNGKINVWKFYAHTIQPSNWCESWQWPNMCINTRAILTLQYVCKDINHSLEMRMWTHACGDIVNIITDVSVDITDDRRCRYKYKMLWIYKKLVWPKCTTKFVANNKWCIWHEIVLRFGNVHRNSIFSSYFFRL